MKPILIDSIPEEYGITKSEVSIMIDGKLLRGYQIAKPLNFEKSHYSLKERFIWALEILKGNAIAVRFFSDFSDEEKIQYVKDHMKKNENKKNSAKPG